MKQITITVPDNCELKQDGNTYTIVEKEKKLTYDDVARELFGKDKIVAYIGGDGSIKKVFNYNFTDDDIIEPNNCTSERQAEKLLAINKLMNVAKYLNGDWQPDWNKFVESKFYIYCNKEQLKVTLSCDTYVESIYFKSAELAHQAIKIIGEETIKLALCTDY